MIYRAMLENGVFEHAWYPNIATAIDEITQRNEAAGRKVDVIRQSDRSAQFMIKYPALNREVEGTIAAAPGAKTNGLGLDHESLMEEYEKLLNEGYYKQRICRMLGISLSTGTSINRLIMERDNKKCRGRPRKTLK